MANELGYHMNLDINGNGIEIKVNGFNDRLEDLLDALLIALDRFEID